MPCPRFPGRKDLTQDSLQTARAAWEVAAGSVGVFGTRVRNRMSSHGQYLSHKSDKQPWAIFGTVLSCH